MKKEKNKNKKNYFQQHLFSDKIKMRNGYVCVWMAILNLTMFLCSQCVSGNCTNNRNSKSKNSNKNQSLK